ncbi:MAG: hypothetical protein M1837_002486 [Sclerophora amabilis]|nr:MAG: hypothetical protein M1837_002486 [Sclerophora amabilis]
MRLASLLGPTAAECIPLLRIWALLSTLLVPSHAINFDPVPAPNLDLSGLGRVGLAGDFDSISLYQYRQQNENGYNTNGSQSILSRFPDGSFTTLASADASIQAMCPFVMRGGQLAGVVVGGNFTSLGGIEAQGVALFDPSTSKVTPLPGLSGKVSALLCDEETNTVYVGGEFSGANSTNAIAWVGTTGWANLPFAGFNGPVTTIAKESNGNIIFGGTFDGLGNTTSPNKKDQQIVNIATANITASSTASTDGFDDPKNIVCKTNGQDGPGNTWLLEDDEEGFWRADFRFGFRPTKMRIWNTHQDGRGTKTFRFTALPINGIMNLTYTDPATGNNSTCDARCPLSDDTDPQYQDFSFINVIGMSGFRIDISEWYGGGGGLNGIELFQDDIYAFALNDLNEPSCANIDFASNSTTTGPWSATPSQESSSDYLTADLSGPNINSGSASVVFQPDIKESGNYSITIYTPGCSQDDTCSNRGRVNVTGVFATGTNAARPLSTEVFQTNDFDKYDQIYTGYVDANSDEFRPSVTLTPSSGQGNDISVVAQRVRFELISSTGGLNGLYEFNSSRAADQSDLSESAINQAGTDLDSDALITKVVIDDGVRYVGGNFSTDDFDNVFAIRGDSSSALPGGGLNAAVFDMLLSDGLLYVGGNFTDTSKSQTANLNNIASYSISDEEWQPLGAGVDGPVHEVVPITLNISNNDPQEVISLTGHFAEIREFGDNEAIPAQGFAIWVPSRKNWLQNLDAQAPTINGQLTVEIKVPGSDSLFAGSLASGGLGASGSVSLSTEGPLGLNPFPVKIQSQSTSQSSKRKRATTEEGISGVVTGYFYENEDRNVTILGGHFTAPASEGSTINNLLFINGSDGDRVTGVTSDIDDSSTFSTLSVHNDMLFAGGTVTGTVDDNKVDGIISYDLVRGELSSAQPPALSGDEVAVNAIAALPGTSQVFVGGSFGSAGQLNCPGVCIYDTSAMQWDRPASGLTGSVAALAWSSNNNDLFVAGNLTVNGTSTSMVIYDAKSQGWTAFQGADDLPGPVTALTAVNDDVSQFWITGASTNGSAFLMKYDGRSFQTVGDTLGKTTRIRGLQLLSLSQEHEANDLLDRDQTLLVTGQLDLPEFGNASSALFDGTTFTPFILSNSGNSPGSLSQIFSQRTPPLKSSGGKLAIGFVVLIALAIALALIFIIVVIGIIAERIRRKREGYMPAPTQMFEKNSNMDRIPPSHLFGSLGPQSHSPGNAPVI